MQQQNKKKIFVLFPSASGHINPVCGLIYELCRQPNIECIFYGIEEHREQIEKTGAQFRLYCDRNLADIGTQLEEKKKKSNLLTAALNIMMDTSEALLPQLLSDVESGKPDLILYDSCFVPVKYLIEIFKNKKTKVKFVEFYPNFVFTKEMMSKMWTRPKNFWSIFNLVLTLFYIFLRQLSFSWKHKLLMFNPFGLITKHYQFEKIVAVVPELQPGRENFDHAYNFVGPCVSEQARNHERTEDKEMNAILNLFPVKEDNTPSLNELKLIYMSLGTTHNFRVNIYETIIQTFKEFDSKPDRHFKSSQFRLVISVGQDAFKFLNEKISKGELKLPENILLRPKVPQLELLKRADIFITHCGMNSTCETIKYAVPVIAIPIEADQPFNSMRICDELSFGVRFDQHKLDANQIADAVDQILSDEKYRNNIKAFSKATSKYVGQIEGTRIILDCLNDKRSTAKIFN